jgi:DNA-binding GntR family transcriptional regulator
MSTEPVGDLVSRLQRPPRRQILGDEVYEGLKALIMNHAIPAGARLNIDALARELGTSSTPIRESLARLESDGLATKLALRGYTAAPLMSQEDLDDLFQLRLLVEPWAAGRAAQRLDETGAGRLEAELATRPEAPDSAEYEGYREFVSHDARLHDLILDLAGNKIARAAVARTHAHVQLFRLSYSKDLGVPTTQEHEAIVKAIIARKPIAARKAMRDHLRTARERLRPPIG